MGNYCYCDVKRIFYDKYSQRYVINYYSDSLITEKNNYSEIFIILKNIGKINIIYFEYLKKNVIAFLDSTEIILLDFENAKIIKKIKLSLDGENKDKINFIEIINNNYLIICCSSFKLFNLFIYNIIEDNSNINSLNFEFLNKISGTYKDIFKIKDTLILRDDEYLIFNQFNGINNNIEEQFKIEFKSDYNIEINDIENDQILIKEYNTATCLIYFFEIYNIKNKLKICTYKCKKNIDNDFLFLEQDYLLRVNINGLNLFNIRNLKDCGTLMKVHYGDNKRKWAVFKDNSGFNVVYYDKLYRIINEDIEFITEINYNRKYNSVVDIETSYIW